MWVLSSSVARKAVHRNPPLSLCARSRQGAFKLHYHRTFGGVRWPAIHAITVATPIAAYAAISDPSLAEMRAAAEQLGLLRSDGGRGPPPALTYIQKLMKRRALVAAELELPPLGLDQGAALHASRSRCGLPVLLCYGLLYRMCPTSVIPLPVKPIWLKAAV